jgi:hypothetical protein
MLNKTLVFVAVASLGSGFAGQALAGAATGAGQQLGMLVQTEGGSSWNLDLTSLVSFNATTGALAFNPAGLTSPVGDALGEWSLAAAGSKDVDGVSILTADRVKWHSWLRADGTSGSSSTVDNPWSSVFTFTAAGNVDPFMSYGFSVKNNTTSTQTYTFTMGEALSPTITGDYLVHADVSGAILNGVGGTAGTVKITPALADQDGDGIAELQVLRLSNDGGLTFVNAGVDAGQGVTAFGSQTYGSYNQDAAGSGNFNYWAFETKFTLSPDKDVASIAGYAEIASVVAAPVPEPLTYSLMLAGLGLMGFVARRRA